MGEVVMDITDFDSARNVQALAKTAVNSSVREMMHTAQEWPFLLATETQTLTQGVSVYDFPSDTSSVDWESFYLKRHSTEDNQPRRLHVISYTEYLDTRRPVDDIGGADNYAIPEVVFQTQDMKFGVSPVPSTDYQIEYKRFIYPDDMVAADDVCIVPSRFDNVILDGAMFYMLMYRSNEQGAAIYRDKLNTGIKTMRQILLDDPLVVRSTMLTPARRIPSLLS